MKDLGTKRLGILPLLWVNYVHNITQLSMFRVSCQRFILSFFFEDETKEVKKNFELVTYSKINNGSIRNY